MRLPLCLAAAVVLLCLSLPSSHAGKYTEAFSKVPWKEFPGGRYKASTNATLTASNIAGNLVQLKPGGMRELHWHNAAEWAVVIDGACMATAMDEGKIHPVDAWNFTAGDVWYFPANIAHSIVGLAPKGCTFVTGFNTGDFDEERAFGVSAWLASLDADTLAQSLGLPKATAARLAGRVNVTRNGRLTGTFMPRGDIRKMMAEAPSLRAQAPKLIHRFPLLQNIPEVENGDGSFINMVDETRFPISTDMAGAIVRIAPGGLRQLHWHLTHDEWQFIVNGTVEVGVFTAPGEGETAVIGAGDLGFAPVGSGHYIRNIGKEDSYVVLIFNKGLFNNVELTNTLGTVPPSWVAASLNTDDATARAIDYTRTGFAPLMKPAAAAAAAAPRKAPAPAATFLRNAGAQQKP